MFPISVGGELDDFVNCTIYDEVNQHMIVAGVSSSMNFVPTENPHGFAYAVDTAGNWIWGKFYYNVGTSLESISGCKLDEENNLLFFGTSDMKPVILKINADKSDKPQNYTILEELEIDTEFKTFSAFYHDVKDPSDGLPYYYMSYIVNETDVYISKISATDMTVTANVKYGALKDELRPTMDVHVPRFMEQDPDDESYLLLIGQFRFKGAIVRIKKWDLSIKNHYEIRKDKVYTYVKVGNETHNDATLTE
jgi:hypothetical protein